MPKIKLTLAALAAVSALGAVAPGRSLAAPAEWMLNKKTLTEEGLTAAALSSLAHLDKPGVLTSANLTLECTGQIESLLPEIIKANKAKAKTLTLTGCAAKTANCTVPTTIGTVPVEGEVTLDGALAVKGFIKPQTGTTFTTINVGGVACAAEGKQPITGDFEVLAPQGQDERTDQLLEVNQAATGLLKFGNGAASLSGAALLLLSSCAAWSFL